ncbi:hypothetical protein LXL04_021110 [Taraxacum kok-saghyz]
MASSSSSSLIVPTSSSQLSKYKVFLNFRGVDTRKNIVDHLYTALEQKGIYTYKDDKTLPRGESIRESLMKAIEESYIAVIVFSKNYANSPWPLDELEHIMKCRDTRGLIVIPFFHKVDPKTVRYQKGRYGVAFFKHKLKNKKRAKSWRKAIVDASNISGWETKCIANGHEAQCIKVIVDTISAELHSETSTANDTSSVYDGLIGIEARMQPLIANLETGLGGVRMIGIWGIGGGGKTTLAASVYGEVYGTFERCCFVENIREESRKTYGLVKLQEKMLSGLLKQMQVHARSIAEGRHMIKDKLRHKKVLIVLDDVDHPDQLEALAGSENWFGEGSRIIITTRDEHLLVSHRVNVIHNICLLNDDEANMLFRKYAFRNSRPVEDYELLLKEFVSFAGGLPLALKVLGSFLYGEGINAWKSALARLQKLPDANILEKLKISFDGLNDVEKRLFLDIARFFRGEHTHEGVMTMLDDWDKNHVRSMKVLIGKGLISILDGEFVMHDLVQEMAHYINREEDDENMFATKVGRRDNAPWSLAEMFRPRKVSDLRLSELVQKQLWEAYKADDSDTLLSQTDEIDDYNKSMVLGHRSSISHGYEDDDEDGERGLTLVTKETEKNERIEREVLKRLEKGKNKVGMEVVETLEDRIVSRVEGVIHERMDRFESKVMERLDMLENIVVKRMGMEGGVVQRIERLTNLIVDKENHTQATTSQITCTQQAAWIPELTS